MSDRELGVGDRVVIMAGTLKGEPGTVVGASQDGTLLIQLPHDGMYSSLPFFPYELKRLPKPGEI